MLRRVVVCLASSSTVWLFACGEGRPAPFPLATLPTTGCVDWTGMPIERVCVPRLARESVELTFEAEAPCGACSAAVDRCTVTVDHHDVTLSLDGRSCQPSASATCASPCGARRATCRIPPLSPGRYTIRWGDGSGHIDVLDVGATSSARVSCEFG